MMSLFCSEAVNPWKKIHGWLQQQMFNRNGGQKRMDAARAMRVLFLGAMIFNAAAYGYPEPHGPFEKGHAPQSVLRVDWEVVNSARLGDGEPGPWCFVAPDDSKKTTLELERIMEAESCFLRITVVDGHGRALSNTWTKAMPSDLFRVNSMDLNQDGRPDFIVDIWNGGCGTAAGISILTFVLSTETGYSATGTYSYYFGSGDIVMFDKAGPYYFIETRFIGNGAERTKDGRNHNFWVYQLYRFNEAEVVEANQDAPGFPKWVWFTFRENHKETDQLTTAQKRRLFEAKFGRKAQSDSSAGQSQSSDPERKQP